MNPRPHFRILGIPIRVEPLFLLVAALMGFDLGPAAVVVTWVAVVFVSVLVHELGHALALRIYGQSASIVLHGFGGLTFSQRRLARFQSIVVSLAGPLTALVLLGLPARFLRDGDFGEDAFRDWFFGGGSGFGLWPVLVFAAYVNVWWSIANLLPIRPLDGGNVLTEIVGLQPARLVSAAVGAAAAIWAYTHTTDFRYAAFLAGFLAITNGLEYRRARTGQRAPSAFDVEAPEPRGGGGVRPGQPGGPTRPIVTGSLPGSAPSPWPAGPPSAPTGRLDPEAVEAFGWKALRDADPGAARRVLSRAAGPVSPFLAASIAVAEGGPLDALVAAYVENPSGPSTLGAAAVADTAGCIPALLDHLLAAGSRGVEAVHSIQTHLQYAQRFTTAAQVGERLHAVSDHRAQVAFDTACSWARAGRADLGLVWIERAVDDGFGAARLLDGEPDLEPIRRLPGWTALRSRVEDRP